MITATFGGKNASEKAFADKLSRKLDWDREFALKAIWEYKKFIFLGVISDFSVTPSKIIDQVWHEHLLFTAGYRSFCTDVIEYNFEHHPELVPVDSQTEAFEAQYFRTIDLYEREFGSEPPAEIWYTTKFKVKRKREDGTDTSSSSVLDSGVPLIDSFPDIDSDGFDYGGGEFGGGGSSGGWDDSGGGSSDGDSGGSSDGGSSCSSSCGGGCGGD
jgi:hypothetical protein